MLNSAKPGPDWRNRLFVWKEPASWVPVMSTWLEFRLQSDWARCLAPGVFRDLCWDDPAWSEILADVVKGDWDQQVEDLATDLEHTAMRAYHGCRTDDAGTYFRDGIRLHDRAEMTTKARRIVEAHTDLHGLRDRLDGAIADVDNSLDIGRLFLVADDKALLEYSAHYLIYGSEWVTAVLGLRGRAILKTIGVPTLIEVNLPLAMVSPQTRVELAVKLLNEWTRRICNKPDWSAPIDFTFSLRSDLPPHCVVGHTHPQALPDPLDLRRVYRSSQAACAFCETPAGSPNHPSSDPLAP